MSAALDELIRLMARVAYERWEARQGEIAEDGPEELDSPENDEKNARSDIHPV